MFRRLTLFVPLLIAVPVCAGPAQVTVSHADLDLASAAGQSTLESRLNGAVRQVCGVSNEPSLKLRMAMAKCSSDARAAAKAQMQVAVARAEAATQFAAASSAPRAQASALR
ncbi:UrcA family protein [Glacieibacterium frigidum]|uniref:UrcA family protein n=1 Tax=Glacieibacterium frigidum TaxID=2593303 RepID=A0A552UFM4_9SPHN|nr:UrcA family protein [Glacieibacterium frigidum]TRW17025.1 UrcA family protein [Glacieibacterium frigidum]